MKYHNLTQLQSIGIMNVVLERLMSLRLSPKKIITGSIILVIQGCFILSWEFMGGPLAVSPAGSIALALLYLVGVSFWPVIFLGSLIALTFIESTLLTTFICSVGYTLQALLGAYLLRHFEYDRLLSRLRDAMILTLSLTVSAFVLPLLSYAAASLFGAPLSDGKTIFFSGLDWSNIWVGTIFSSLIFTPLILRWSLRPHARSPQELLETALVSVLLVVISVTLFWTDTRAIGGVSLAYLLLIPFLWTAIRLGPRIMVSALSLSACIGIARFIYESSTYGTSLILNQEFFQTQIFFSMIAAMFIIIVSIEEERKEKTKELEGYVTGLRTEIRELSDDDKLKNEFIATLAHELRNPLAPVVSTLELLRMREELSREALQLVNRVEHQTETIRKLLDDLLDVSRITQKKFKLAKERSLVKELLYHCANTAEHIMKSYGHTFTMTVPEEDIFVMVDPTRFEQIITNLLFNAAKYTDPGGRIELICDVYRGDLRIRLQDNGIGIDPEHLEQIFLPFRQMRTKHHVGTGLGIGLAITKQLVEMHEGTITAESEGIGKGSKFTIILPIIIEEKGMADAGKDADIAAQVHARNILVVDDNVEAALALARLLEYRGHQVYVAHSGHEALENARLFKPEVILLDIGLPDIDGYEVARQLRLNGVRSKLIAVTGYGQEEDKQKAEEANFNYHLVKPVTLAEIEKLL